MKTLNDIAAEPCPNCGEVGTAINPPQGKICVECLKPWKKPKPYKWYILGAWVAFWMSLYVIHLMFK